MSSFPSPLYLPCSWRQYHPEQHKAPLSPIPRCHKISQNQLYNRILVWKVFKYPLVFGQRVSKQRVSCWGRLLRLSSVRKSLPRASHMWLVAVCKNCHFFYKGQRGHSLAPRVWLPGIHREKAMTRGGSDSGLRSSFKNHHVPLVRRTDKQIHCETDKLWE